MRCFQIFARKKHTADQNSQCHFHTNIAGILQVKFLTIKSNLRDQIKKMLVISYISSENKPK